MTRLPRLIATDIDGTLAMPDGTVSPRSAKALAAVSAAGTVIVLVTGRPTRWLTRVYADLHEPYPAVCANGAVVYDPNTDTVLSAELIGAGVLAPAVQRIREALPDATFAIEVEGGRRMLYEAAYPLGWDADDPHVRTAPLPEIVGSSAVKLLVRAPGWDPDRLTAAVAGAAGPVMEATHSSGAGLVELTAAGVTKATGLAAYASLHGLGPTDALVFGDMPNDLPMFAWAGAGSVAVANAHPLVRAAATAITASNAEDGVAAYLEALLGREMSYRY